MRPCTLGLFLLLAVSCASSPPPRSRPAPPSPKKPTCMTEGELLRAASLGELTYGDMESATKKAATACLAGAWLPRLTDEKGHKPAIRFYPMRNRTSSHINWMTMVKQLEAALNRSGKVTLVADLETAQVLRADRAGAPPGQETAADLVATGWITGTTEAVSGTETAHTYTIAWELVRTDTDEKVWVHTETVKKLVQVLPPCPKPEPKPARGD